MTEDYNKPIKEALGPAAKNFGKEIAPIGSDLGQKAVMAYEKVKEVITYGMNVSNEAWQYFWSELNTRLEKEPESEVVSPKLMTAGPALNHFRYLAEEKELQEMFVNLFASSMLKNKQSYAHPSFVEVLKQISSDEAKIIKFFQSSASKSFPVITLIAKNSANNGFTTAHECLSLVGLEAKCEIPGNTPVYIKNLDRLGILQHVKDAHFVDENRYREIENHPSVLEFKTAIEERGQRPEIRRGLVKLTDYGITFCHVCVSS